MKWSGSERCNHPPAKHIVAVATTFPAGDRGHEAWERAHLGRRVQLEPELTGQPFVVDGGAVLVESLRNEQHLAGGSAPLERPVRGAGLRE